MQAVRWTLADGACLRARRWDESWVIFDEGSGSTFLVSRLVGQILDIVASAGAIDASALRDCLVESGLDGVDTLQTADVEQELTRLARLALVDRTDC